MSEKLLMKLCAGEDERNSCFFSVGQGDRGRDALRAPPWVPERYVGNPTITIPHLQEGEEEREGKEIE